MEKVTVEICSGTTCYLLGADRLLELGRALPPAWEGRVEFLARPCHNRCESDNLKHTPFVLLNGGEVMTSATPEKLRARIDELLAAGEGGKC